MPQLRIITPHLIEFYWEEKPSDHLLQQILSWQAAIQIRFESKIIRCSMGFQTLSCQLQNKLTSTDLENWKSLTIEKMDLQPLPERIWKIPVCYDPELGKDLSLLAETKSMGINEFIRLHTEPTYRIHFFGFLPGFMYLNGLNDNLHFPRKKIPDQSIPQGSVAIGGTQTGVYPMKSPGGWHLIGRSPLIFFDPKSNPPVFAKAGDRIQFISIERREFDEMMKNPIFPKTHD